MGDVVYPGIVLTRVYKDITELDVQNYISRVLGIGKNQLRDGRAKVEIFKRDWNATVVISGVLFNLDHLRDIICHKKLLNRFVFLESVDFGVQRNGRGVMDHHYYQLHKHLQEGQGILKPLNIFSDTFVESFGNIEQIGYSIFFDDVKEHVPDEYLYGCKDVLLFGNIPKKSKSGVVFGQTKMGYENMEIILKSRLDAIQRICMWNKNSSFSLEQKSFVTGKDGLLCRFTSQCGLGVTGSFLDVDVLVKAQGYIPLACLNGDIFSKIKLDNLAIKCEACAKKYEILGIDKDISWMAASCGCKLEGPGRTWPGEKFFRLTTPLAKRKYIPTEDDDENCSTVYDRIVRLIPGLKPMYENVEEFRTVAYGAYCSEYRFNKRLLRSQQTTGVLIAQDFIEVVEVVYEGKEKKEVKIERWAYYFKVDQSKVWSEKGQHGIKTVTIVPLVETQGLGIKGSSSSSSSSPATKKEENNHLWISSSCYQIAPIQGTKQVKVTLTLTVEPGRKLNVGRTAVLIPKPPDDEKKAICNSIVKWENYVTNINRPKIHSIVHSAVVCDETVWNADWEIFNVWYVKLVVGSSRIMEKLSKLLYECYIGIEAKLLGCVQVCTARIVGMEDLPGGQKLLQVVFVLKKHIQFILGTQLPLSIWMITPSEDKLHIHIPREDERYQEEEQTHYVFRRDLPPHLRQDDLGEDDDKNYEYLEYQYGRVENENVFEKFIQVFVDKNLCEQRINNLDWILRRWRDKPENDLSILNNFLYPSSSIKHDGKIPLAFIELNEPLISSIRSILNPSQAAGIDKMMVSDVSLCQGPPGTGKTSTGIHGVLELSCRERGLIIICCPSNFASNVFYEKLVSANLKFKVGLSITRMYSESREREHASKIASIMDEGDEKIKNNMYADVNLLHVAVRQHPFWRLDEHVNAIVDKVEQGRGALLTTAEKKSLRAHTMYITQIILSSSDVIICTVSTSSDSRMDRCLKYCRRFEKPLSALVIDEASLLNVPATIPVLCFNPKRVWLLGDDCQLRPTVFDETSRFACLDVSWMEFLRLTPYFKQRDMFVMLNIQYRMAESIADVVSSFMYYGRVRSSKSVKSRNYPVHGKLRLMPELQSNNIAIYTYDGYGERKPEKSMSYTNDKEVAITRSVLLRLNEQGVDFSTVVIISMYDGHVSFLQNMVSELRGVYNEIEVATVDSYQGKENNIVILNTVRSNLEHNIGFLREKRRLNVATSRSIDYLLLVSDIKTLNKSELPDMCTLMKLLANQEVTVKEYRCGDREIKEITCSSMQEFLQNC